MTEHRDFDAADGRTSEKSVYQADGPISIPDCGPGTVHRHFEARAKRAQLIGRLRALARWVGNRCMNLRARFARQRARRATMRALYSLDERLLRDIGIEPGQVAIVVDGLLDAKFREPCVVVPYTGGTPGEQPGRIRQAEPSRDQAA